MAVYVGSARSDENNAAYGGKAGDQKSGKEVSVQKWYNHSKGWRVFRALDPKKAAIIGDQMRAACANENIGYDQWQRYNLFKEAEKVGFDLAKVSVPTECDCSELVRCCCAAAGILDLPKTGFRTANMPKYLLACGAFVELTGAKYTQSSAYLGKGDILVTATSGHTVVVLDNGDKYDGSTKPEPYKLGDRTLKRGMQGEDVQAAQKLLIAWDAACMPVHGADSDFGAETESAVMAYQTAHNLKADGIIGPKTLKSLRGVSAVNPYNEPTHNVKKGFKGEAVSWVQWELKRHNKKALPKSGIDGDFGGETMKAVQEFQRAHGLAADGIVGKLTRAALKEDA